LITVIEAGPSCEGSEDFVRMGNPAENAALGFGHLQAHFLEFGKVGTHAIFWNQAIVATIVGLTC
jgi:hypothetical protein